MHQMQQKGCHHRAPTEICLFVMSRQAQHAMGSMGLPVLLSVVHEDRDDIELLQLALESLVLSFGAGEGPGGTPGARQAAQREVRGSLSSGTSGDIQPKERSR